MKRRVTYLLVGASLVLALGGCGADGPATDPSTGATQAGADVRERLLTGLAAVSPTKAELVETNRTTLTPVDAPWLRGWQVLDVEVFMKNHPKRFFAALSEDDTVRVLSGDPDSFVQMARSAQVVVDDAEIAVEVGNLYLDVTRDFVKYSYRIDSLSDVQWPELNPEEQQQVADFEAQYGALVQPPTAESSDAGWTMTAWTIYERTLVRHHLTIAADGSVQDSQEVVASDLLLPQSL